MANLKVVVVVRVKCADGKRNWARANGKTDSPGPLYLRWYEGSKQRHTKAGATFDEAELAASRLERKLKAASQGFVVPDDNSDTKNSHRGYDCLDAYLKLLRTTTKRNGRKYNER